MDFVFFKKQVVLIVWNHWSININWDVSSSIAIIKEQRGVRCHLAAYLWVHGDRTQTFQLWVQDCPAAILSFCLSIPFCHWATKIQYISMQTITWTGCALQYPKRIKNAEPDQMGSSVVDQVGSNDDRRRPSGLHCWFYTGAWVCGIITPFVGVTCL